MDIFCGTKTDIYNSTNNIDTEIVMGKVNFNDEMLILVSKFTSENGIRGKTTSIVPLLIKVFANERENFDLINTQYRALADTEELKLPINDNISTFWSKIADF